MMPGGQGTGRSSRLAALAAEEAAGAPALIVDPLCSWTPAMLAAVGGGSAALRGRAASDPSVFAVIDLLMRASPGLVVAVDDSEHLPPDRRGWSSMAAVAAETGALVLVVSADLSGDAGRPAAARPRPAVASYPGGAAAASLSAA